MSRVYAPFVSLYLYETLEKRTLLLNPGVRLKF